jgi:vacuolar iron transporter family protein
LATLSDTERRQRFERLSNIREVVFGMQDGILTTAGILFGLAGALPHRYEVILTALASTAAGSISMGAGAYLGTSAEIAVLRGELDRAREAASDQPYLVQESLLNQLAKEGLSREAGYRVVKLLSQSPEALARTTEQKVFGVSLNLSARPLLDGVVMGAAFVVGALVPLLPYLAIANTRGGLAAALASTAVALFGIGYFTGWLAERSRWRAGTHFLLVAIGAALAGFVLGKLIGAFGGVSISPVS